MGKITIDQSHQIIATLLVNTDWGDIDFNGLCLQDKIIRNPKEAGLHFEAFLKNGGRVFPSVPVIISIDRNEPFNPVKFLGDGWGIWKGPADGIGIEGDTEEDSQSLRLDSIDLTKVYFETTLSEGESAVSGEDKLTRLKNKELIRIDAKAFQTIWENRALIPESWRQCAQLKKRYIYFDGAILRDPRGNRRVLYMFWVGGEWWLKDCPLNESRDSTSPSAVLLA